LLSILFPYTSLFRSELDHLADFLDLVLEAADVLVGHPRDAYVLRFVDGPEAEHRLLADYHWPAGRHGTLDCEIYRLTHDVEGKGDRKSTRLNSSHVA